MFGLGLPEILIILIIILFIFGAKRLPGIGTGLGKTVKEIKDIKKELSGNQENKNTPESGDEKQSKVEAEKNNTSGSIRNKLTDQVVSKVPGLKQARQIKDKADKIKKIL